MIGSFASLVAQAPLPDGFVPRGYGSLAGYGTGAIWDAEKSRRVVLIDRAQFPWGAGNPGVIQGFRLRRSGGVLVPMAGTQKTIRVRGSATRESPGGTTPTGPRAQNAVTALNANHGNAQPTLCYDGPFHCPWNSRLLSYYQNMAVPVRSGDGNSVTVTFTTPLQVPADADTVVLDIEVANPPGSAWDNGNPVWWPEEIAVGSSQQFTGGYRLYRPSCLPAGARSCYDSSGAAAPCLDRGQASDRHIGGQFTTALRVGKGQMLMFAWIGAIVPAPFFFPGVSCEAFVDPGGQIVFLGESNDPSCWTNPNCSNPNPTDTEVSHTWGMIPAVPWLVGLQVGVQFAAYDLLAPAETEFSGIYELMIGPAPSPQAVEFRTVVAACDGTDQLSGVSECDAATNPFFDPLQPAPGPIGAFGNTPVLQLF
ncbi:MAG: hypothetical protein KF830_07380 [Planctomycetes bacterium]|nr:hypothetical protein [Planctomycetota bacterium]